MLIDIAQTKKRSLNRRFVQTLLWGLAMLACVARADAPPPDYRLGPGDLIRVSAFGAPEMTSEVRVAESGAISLPLVGAVPVAGLSPSEAETLLARKYSEGGFLKQPQISVLVLEYLSQKVAVLGHVTKPGQYPLRTSAHVLDLIADAGGLISASAADHAILSRANGTQTEVDLAKLFDGDPSQNLAVQGGDRLFVPKADQFYVYGQVNKPGAYKLERNMTVSRAISISGGLTPRGTERRAIVKRRDASGKEKEYSVKSSDILKPDDVLFIKESLF